MADSDILAEEPALGQELAPAAENAGLRGFTEALREEIMVDVEAVLSQKSDAMWKRGQAELGKMQQDRKEVASSIAGLQQRQDMLISEQTAMHGALLDITAKMEFVAMEMREALRNVAKVGAAELATPPVMPLAAPFLADLSALGLGAPSLQGLEFESVDAALTLQGLCTPPRNAPPALASPSGYSIAPPLPGSPAVLLSLASALPSAPAASTVNPGTTRLHIADCLDMSPVSTCETKGFYAYGAGTSSVSTSSSPLLGGVNGSPSSMGSPSSAERPQEGMLEGPCWPSAAPGLSKASGGTLRADAPAFVPGGSF